MSTSENATPRTATSEFEKYRPRVLQLLRYLEEYVKMKGASPVRDVAQYANEGLLLWFDQLPRENAVFCQAWAVAPEGQADLWLKVQRQDLPPCPQVPDELEPWVEISEVQRSGGPEPQLRPVAFLPIPPTNAEEPGGHAAREGDQDEPAQSKVWQHQLEDHPEVPERWRRYLERWVPWSAEHARKSSIQSAYATLYSAYQKQKRMGEDFELIVGMGLLVRREPNGRLVRRHTLAAQATLEFDAKRGIVSLRCPPAPGGAHVQPEDEFLEPDQRPLREAYTALEDELATLGDAVWDKTQMMPILRGWANSIPPSPGPSFSEVAAPPAGTAVNPVLTWSPALILRRRTVRGTLALYRRLIATISTGAPIPFGLARLVDYLDDEKRTASGGPGEPDRSVQSDDGAEVYFPLPSNDQQRAIVRQLEQSRGVLVQGPPGTGKSQTIANLICHLLATGKRVLVTAETARALAVLKKKIPPKVRPLCVSLLGADEASFSELNAAVTGIGNRHSQWNDETQAASVRNVAHLERELLNTRAQRAGLERELRAFREAEAEDVTVAGGSYHGTAAAIAKRVGSERADYQWLTLHSGALSSPPLTDSEASELLGLVREFRTTDPSQSGDPVPPLADLPTPAQFARQVAAEAEAVRATERHRSHMEAPNIRGLFEAEPGDRVEIRARLQEFQAGWDALSQRPEPWIGDALREVLGEADAPWRVRAERTPPLLEGARELFEQGRPASLTVPAGMTEERVRADAGAVLDHFRRGGRWSRFGIRPRAVRGRVYLRSQVMVNGAPVSTAEDLGAIIRLLDARRAVADAEGLWPDAPVGTSAQLETRVATLDENLEAVSQIFALLDHVRAVMGRLGKMNPPVAPPRWSRDGVAALRDAVDAADAVDRARCATRDVEAIATVLRRASATGSAGAPAQALLDAVSKRDPQAWSEAYALARLLERRAARLQQFAHLRGRLIDSAPRVWGALRGSADEPIWERRLSSFNQAWQWALADDWLARRRDPDEIARLERGLDAGQRREEGFLAELAAERAWSHFLSRLTVKQRMNLVEWKNSIKAIGKGTGKGAATHRAAALQSMSVCVEAIPIWVLPRYRVMDAFDPKPDMFDCIIVDEASQMGIEGLCLWGLGKQIVVVGDPEQISPTGSFMPLAPLAALAALFLKDIPFPNSLGPRASLYMHAERFTRKTVLREHFRCVPEIIGFSDQLCYAPNGTPLIPLRNYEPARLEPIQTRFVRDGFQEGRAGNALNRPEAQALVQQIVACARDSAYTGKTFGVISLLGEAQGRLIERLLLSALGPEEMEERRLDCGDAYAFQGDERDVIFLSMVSAPNARIGVLGGEDAKQRFNVAASRARDQVWLFHSAAPEDLSDSCMRRAILQYYLNPNVEDTAQPATFDSEFERHVYERIRAKGYRVRTQVPGGDQTTNQYRIDLVVEGDRARLAVECDGDEWHGAEKYEADLYRQRQLERSGWPFLRIWASDFYRDPDQALAPLWRELDRLGIEPAGMRQGRVAPPPPVEELGATSAIDDTVIATTEESIACEEPSDMALLDVAPPAVEAAIGPSPTAVVGLRGPLAAAGPVAGSQAARRAAQPVPMGDVELLAYFDSVPAPEWADLAQWAKIRSPWDGTRKKLIARISKLVGTADTLAEGQRIWAARLHILACRLGFHPHAQASDGTGGRGQGRLPFTDDQVT